MNNWTDAEIDLEDGDVKWQADMTEQGWEDREQRRRIESNFDWPAKAMRNPAPFTPKLSPYRISRVGLTHDSSFCSLACCSDFLIKKSIPATTVKNVSGFSVPNNEEMKGSASFCQRSKTVSGDDDSMTATTRSSLSNYSNLNEVKEWVDVRLKLKRESWGCKTSWWPWHWFQETCNKNVLLWLAWDIQMFLQLLR